MARYPAPEIPIRPILSFASFTGGASTGVPSVEDAGQCVWLTSGRIATAVGLRNEGIGPGDEVLLPAYYCSTMIQAVESIDAIPVYYKSLPDLSIDLDDVADKITARSRALLAVHFFGFPQEIISIKKFCVDAGLVLVEDCAHAYFGQYCGKPLGAYGDFSITSALKFFPISDGGALIAPHGKEFDAELYSGGVAFEAKAFINNIERSIRYKRLQPFTLLLKLPILLKDWVWSALKRGSRTVSVGAVEDEISLGPDSSYGGYGFDAAWLDVRMSGFSHFLIKRLPRARIVEVRRHNFNRLLAALSNCDNAEPLHSSLPDDVVPYAFPLLVSNVDKVFPIMKQEGIPILRWDDAEGEACAVSARYSTQLLQLPCHQEISTKELDWMIGRIRSILSEAA